MVPRLVGIQWTSSFRLRLKCMIKSTIGHYKDTSKSSLTYFVPDINITDKVHSTLIVTTFLKQFHGASTQYIIDFFSWQLKETLANTVIRAVMTYDKNIIYLLFLMRRKVLVPSFLTLALRFFSVETCSNSFSTNVPSGVSSRGPQRP